MQITKYYLHGGNSSDNSHKNKQFRRELISSVKPDSKFLFCYFANDQTEWEYKFNRDKDNFIKLSKKLYCQMALEENFSELCIHSDVVIFTGGDTFLLIEKLRRYINFKELLLGKVIVGSSAGACALSKYFYSNDEDKCADGLGILNLKLHCHYSPEKLGNVLKLKSYGINSEIIVLPEKQYISLFQ